jgi:hypothetical protein
VPTSKEFIIKFRTKAKAVTPVKNSGVDKTIVPANEGIGQQLDDEHHAIDHAIKCSLALCPDKLPEFDSCHWINDVS